MYAQAEKPKQNGTKAKLNSVAQRKISNSQNKRTQEPAEKEQLETIVRDYIRIKGEAKETEIMKSIQTLEDAPGWYSLNSVRAHLQKIEPDRVVFGKYSEDDIDGPTLPVGDSGRNTKVTVRRQAIKDFSFASVTTLVAIVTLENGDSFKVELRNEDKEKIKGKGENRGHAERLLLQQIDAAVVKKKSPPSNITITINNSPCGDCTADIINWVKKYEGVAMQIHYVIPYGEVSSLDDLAEGGISSKPLAVLDYVGNDTDDELVKSEGKKTSPKAKFLGYALRAKAFEASRQKIENGEESSSSSSKKPVRGRRMLGNSKLKRGRSESLSSEDEGVMEVEEIIKPAGRSGKRENKMIQKDLAKGIQNTRSKPVPKKQKQSGGRKKVHRNQSKT
jgi:hypothetical protein